MILQYPKVKEVERWTPQLNTFELVRASALLPPPVEPHEVSMRKLIQAKLKACDQQHRERIEEVIGYGPG